MRPPIAIPLLLALAACAPRGTSEAPAGVPSAAASPVLAALERVEDLRLGGAGELAAAFAAAEPASRERAALAAGRIQDPVHGAVLGRLALADADPAVRSAAIFALGQLGLAEGARPPVEAVAAVESLLAGDDAALAALAVEAYGKLAPAGAADKLVAALRHPSPRVRAEAALALFRLRFVPQWRGESEGPATLPSAAVEALSAAMGDPSLEVRRAAVYACSRFGEPGAVAALRARLGEDDLETRLFAARALGRSGDAAAVGDLVARTGDAAAAVRAEAVAALASLGAADRIPISLVRDASSHVRAALARALAKASAETAPALLTLMTADASPSVCAAAIESMASLDPVAARGLLELKLSPRTASALPWQVVAAATRAAGRLGPSGLPWIEAGLASSDRRVQVAALEALGGATGERADELLRRALAESDLAVRGTAVQAVVDRKLPDALSLLDLARERSPGEEWIEIREGIADALAPLPGAEGLLRRLAEDEAPSVRSKAVLALRKRGIEVAPPPPVAIVPSPFLGRGFEADPVVVLETSKGVLEIRCFGAEAPLHVANFVSLVERGFYDGSIWHRVVGNFVIQGGDPRGDGWGGSGTTLRDEIGARRFVRGTVGMPKAGKDTGGGQLFITHVSTPHLDGNYTVFGQVVAGLEVVDAIEVGDSILRARIRK